MSSSLKSSHLINISLISNVRHKMFILEEGNGEENMTLTSTNISSKDLHLHNNNSSKLQDMHTTACNMTVIACQVLEAL